MPFCPSCGTQVAPGAVCSCKTRGQAQQPPSPYGQPQQPPNPYGQPQNPYGQQSYNNPYGMHRAGGTGFKLSVFDIVAMACVGLGLIMLFLPFFSVTMEEYGITAQGWGIVEVKENVSLTRLITEEGMSPLISILIIIGLAGAAAMCFIKKLPFAVKMIPAALVLLITMFYTMFNKLELMAIASGYSTSGMSSEERRLASEYANEVVGIGVGAILLMIAMVGFIVAVIIPAVKKN